VSDIHILCDNVVRIYKSEGIEVVALQGLDLVVERGELIALVGASGSGKSTLLNILSGLDVPTAGLARVGGQDLLAMDAKERLRFRRHVAGFVWQQTQRNLLAYLTAAENVAVPMVAARVDRRERDTRVGELLELLGVGNVGDRRPGELSGGEQQRVAIAVALANRPEVLFADEPTGALDSASGETVLDSFTELARRRSTTVLLVTHEARVASYADRTLYLRDGVLV
jgi:ABC-type lipoprotein export system ATPase subunit